MMPRYLEYFPVDQRRGGQLQAPGGGLYSQWATGGNFEDYWGNPNDWANTIQPEVFGLEVIDGEGWLTLRGFVPKVGPMHQLKTLKAFVTRDSKAKEIACRDGHPYALLTVQPHAIEVWGTIADSLRFYWFAEYRLIDELNPILQETRACVEQREVWANSDGTPANKWQWTRGGPLPFDAIPFDKAGKPIDIVTNVAGYQCVGLNYGPAWTLGSINNDVRILHAAANSHGWDW